MNRLLLCTATLMVALVGCTEPTSHRNPAFAKGLAPGPTLLTGPVPCLDKAVVAAGGQTVHRATAFGEDAVQKLNMSIAQRGDTAPAFASALCIDLASPEAMHRADWLNPKPPPILVELAQMADSKSVFVPVVTSKMSCGSSHGPWIWGEPVYEDDRGAVDCIDKDITLIGYLFDAQGTVIWKGVRHHVLSEVPNFGRLAGEFMARAPIGEVVTFKRPAAQ